MIINTLGNLVNLQDASMICYAFGVRPEDARWNRPSTSSMKA